MNRYHIQPWPRICCCLLHLFEANTARSVPIKSCSKEELLCAYHKIYNWLTLRGFKPLLHKLDNKTSKDVKAFVATEETCIQYTPRASIAQTPPNTPYAHGRIIVSPAWQAFQNRSPLPSGAASQLNAIPHSTCYIHVVKILSSWYTKCSKICSPSTLHPWHP